nr:putative gustatory receptor 59f [Aedes albopictus]
MTSPNTSSYYVNRELCKSFATIQRFCLLFGTAPYSLDMSSASSLWYKNELKQTTIYGVQLSWTAIIYGCHLYCAYQTITQTTQSDILFFTKLLYNTEIIASTIGISLIFISCRYYSAQYKILADKLVEILTGFEQFGDNDMLQKVQRRLKVVLIFATVLFTISAICDFNTRATLSQSLVSVGSYIVPHWITVMGLIQYTFVASVIHQITRHSNDIVKKQIKSQRTITEKSAFSALEVLQQKVLLINHLMYDVNRVFGWLFLNTIILAILVSSIQFLEGYQFSYRKAISKEDLTYFIYTITWTILQLGHLMLFLYPNHLVKYEMKKIGLNLCEIDGPQLNAIVEKFSRQLLLHDGYYLACGIVELDLKLLTTIFGALTTYMVLLIQYDTGAQR